MSHIESGSMIAGNNVSRNFDFLIFLKSISCVTLSIKIIAVLAAAASHMFASHVGVKSGRRSGRGEFLDYANNYSYNRKTLNASAASVPVSLRPPRSCTPRDIAISYVNTVTNHIPSTSLSYGASNPRCTLLPEAHAGWTSYSAVSAFIMFASSLCAIHQSAFLQSVENNNFLIMRTIEDCRNNVNCSIILCDFFNFTRKRIYMSH